MPGRGGPRRNYAGESRGTDAVRTEVTVRPPRRRLATTLVALAACSPAEDPGAGDHVHRTGTPGAGAPGVPGFAVPDGGGMPGKPPPCGPGIEGPGENKPCPDAAPCRRRPRRRHPRRTPRRPACRCRRYRPWPRSPAAPEKAPVEVQVRAWGATPTCVYLKAGETAEITATGRWTSMGGREVGPEGAAPNEEGCPRGALVARVAKFHQRTCIRARGSITAQRDGYVWLYQSGGWNAMESSGARSPPPSPAAAAATCRWRG